MFQNCVQDREGRPIPPPYNSFINGGPKQSTLAGGSVPPSSWHPRPAFRYYGDSDDDSGIGHSNGGQGDRVGSTSSADTEVAHDFSFPTPKSTVYHKSWSPSKSPTKPSCGTQQVPHCISADPLLLHRRIPAYLHLTVNSEFRPPAVSTPDNCNVLDDIFNPQRGTVLRLPCSPAANSKMPVYDHPKPTANGSYRNCPVQRSRTLLSEQFTSKPVPNYFRNQQSASSYKDGVHRRPEPLSVGHKPMGSFQLPAREFRSSSSPSTNRPRPGDVRRVWSYCGDSSYYANIYENYDAKNRGGVSKDMVQVRARPVAAVEGESALAQNAVKLDSFLLNGASAMGRKPGAQPGHGDYDRLEPWNDDRRQGAHSASLASLITVDSELVHVHACPASVIPASEIGDSLSESFSSRHGTLEIYRHKVQLPPLPPPPPPSGHQAPRGYQLPPPPPPPVVRQASSPYAVSPVVGFSGKHQSTAIHGCVSAFPSEGAYATVNKPKQKSKTPKQDSSQVLDDSRKRSSASFTLLDDVEPPLPPRNYRRSLTESKQLSTSKGSLTVKMHGLSRSAKQVLRKAFSLEGLNCASDSHHSADDSGDWDNEVDWWRVTNPKPRTPAAVKARDASRQRLHRSHSTKQSMATLC